MEKLLNITGILVILIISIIPFFIGDSNNKRRKILNILLAIVLFSLLIPLLLAFLFSGGVNIWNESSGGGVFLWLYLIILPISIVAYSIITVFKIIFGIIYWKDKTGNKEK